MYRQRDSRTACILKECRCTRKCYWSNIHNKPKSMRSSMLTDGRAEHSFSFFVLLRTNDIPECSLFTVSKYAARDFLDLSWPRIHRHSSRSVSLELSVCEFTKAALRGTSGSLLVQLPVSPVSCGPTTRQHLPMFVINKLQHSVTCLTDLDDELLKNTVWFWKLDPDPY